MFHICCCLLVALSLLLPPTCSSLLSVAASLSSRLFTSPTVRFLWRASPSCSPQFLRSR